MDATDVRKQEDYVDSRVQSELETLNSAAEEINKLEKELDFLNCKFRTTLQESSHLLKQTAKKLRRFIDKARPYYVALAEAGKAQQETQKAAQQYQRSCSIHSAAKETIALAEDRLFSIEDKREFDAPWQEMLNHATIKVNQSEVNKATSENEHQLKSTMYVAAQGRVAELQRKLRSSITKSQVYFEQKAAFEQHLRQQKSIIEGVQKSVAIAKASYKRALQSLESISNEVHEQRKVAAVIAKQREPGVGCDALPPINLDVACDDAGSECTTDDATSLSSTCSTASTPAWMQHECLSRKPSDFSICNDPPDSQQSDGGGHTPDGASVTLSLEGASTRLEEYASGGSSSNISEVGNSSDHKHSIDTKDGEEKGIPSEQTQ